VPVELIDKEHWSRYGTRVRSALLEDSKLATLCIGTINQVRAEAVALCDKEGHILEFVAAVLPALVPAAEQHAREYAPAVRRARDFVTANWHRPFSLTEVAQEVGASKWHLTRAFREALGISPGDYARSLRGSHALKAIATQTPLSVVAVELGYSDQAHLTREVRRLYGFTPGHYRSPSTK
jgi:AraC-like DNA-binding protein